jgi:hypothetical protein
MLAHLDLGLSLSLFPQVGIELEAIRRTPNGDEPANCVWELSSRYLGR